MVFLLPRLPERNGTKADKKCGNREGMTLASVIESEVEEQWCILLQIVFYDSKRLSPLYSGSPLSTPPPHPHFHAKARSINYKCFPKSGLKVLAMIRNVLDITLSFKCLNMGHDVEKCFHWSAIFKNAQFVLHFYESCVGWEESKHREASSNPWMDIL